MRMRNVAWTGLIICAALASGCESIVDNSDGDDILVTNVYEGTVVQVDQGGSNNQADVSIHTGESGNVQIGQSGAGNATTVEIGDKPEKAESESL